MYKVDLYINNQKADLFENESIEINLSTQNIKDISKVFGDFTNSFTIPASTTNNKIFKHYYNVDIDGGYISNLRTTAFIEVNNNLFRAGVLELEGVQMKKGQPYAYNVGFYSNVTSLKDKFGEDTLNDLDLSSLNHTYNDTNIEAGLNGYVSGTDDSIIYPLISPVANWIYDSTSSDSGANNIWYHNGHPEHGVFYYDLKPAVRLTKIIDAIEAKYSITFDSSFFASNNFSKLFMWCHRRAGYMFKDQTYSRSAISEKIDFTTAGAGDFNTTNDRYEINTASQNPAKVIYNVSQFGVTDTKYAIEVYVNDIFFSSKDFEGDSGNSEVILPPLVIGDYVDLRVVSKEADLETTLTSVTATWYEIDTATGTWTTNDVASTSANQVYAGDVDVAAQLPEQKISDFIGSLVRAFNLVIVPTGNNKYDIESLDAWYTTGITREITEYVDTEEVNIRKPQLYRRINFAYNETEAVLGEQYRLQNDIGYGDLRADFSFDGEDFDVKVGFDNMLFERLDNLNNGLSEINVGKSITRELEPYIGQPFIFFATGTITVSDNTERFGYIDMSGNENAKDEFWLVSNLNGTTAEEVTATLNFSTEVDPYLLQGFSGGLYDLYWKNYITNLYNSNRRVFSFNAQLPLGLMLALKTNDSLIINERSYIINQLKLNLSTGQSQLELINDLGKNPTSFVEMITEDGDYIISEQGEYLITQ